MYIIVVSSSSNHIDVIVGRCRDDQWRFKSKYGFTDSNRKIETLLLLRHLHHRFSFPWLSTGDFNEILWSHKKIRLNSRQEDQLREFRDALDECGFMELGFMGGQIYMER